MKSITLALAVLIHVTTRLAAFPVALAVAFRRGFSAVKGSHGQHS